jgi:hypothetical protein
MTSSAQTEEIASHKCAQNELRRWFVEEPTRSKESIKQAHADWKEQLVRLGEEQKKLADAIGAMHNKVFPQKQFPFTSYPLSSSV